MPKAKAVAIAITRRHPVLAHLMDGIGVILDFMYGTEQRTRYTYAFAIVLFMLGIAMNGGQQSCSIDTLPVNF